MPAWPEKSRLARQARPTRRRAEQAWSTSDRRGAGRPGSRALYSPISRDERGIRIRLPSNERTSWLTTARTIAGDVGIDRRLEDGRDQRSLDDRARGSASLVERADVLSLAKPRAGVRAGEQCRRAVGVARHVRARRRRSRSGQRCRHRRGPARHPAPCPASASCAGMRSMPGIGAGLRRGQPAWARRGIAIGLPGAGGGNGTAGLRLSAAVAAAPVPSTAWRLELSEAKVATAEHQGDRAAGGKPEIVAPGLLLGDDRKGVLAGDDQRLLAELKPRIGRLDGDRQRSAKRLLLPRPADGVAAAIDGDSISCSLRGHPSACRCKGPSRWRASPTVPGCGGADRRRRAERLELAATLLHIGAAADDVELAAICRYRGSRLAPAAGRSGASATASPSCCRSGAPDSAGSG